MPWLAGEIPGSRPFAEDDEVREDVVVEARPRMLMPEDSLGDIPSLEPPPGVGRLEGGSGRSIGEASASALPETDMPLAALLDFCRQQVLEPGWEVQEEAVADDLAVLTWSFQDDDGFSWFGVLLVTPGSGSAVGATVDRRRRRAKWVVVVAGRLSFTPECPGPRREGGPGPLGCCGAC